MDNVNKAKAIAEFIFSNGRSRAASIGVGVGSNNNNTTTSNGLPEPRAWEMDENGVIVSKPITKQEKENCTVTHLGGPGKSASIPVTMGENINKLKAIVDFIRTNGRI